MSSVLLEARPYRPFKSSEEYLYAMREDLAEWLNTMYPELRVNVDNFMDRLDTGVALCKHANNVRRAAEEYLLRRQARNKSMTKSMTSGLAGPILSMGNVHFLPAAKSGTFFARDNVSNFIAWCRKSLQIFECLLFETDDLIMRKNEKHVILCLLEVARRGAKFGMLAPMLVQMERQIDKEIAADNKANGIGCGTQTDGNVHSVAIGVEDNLFESDSEDEDDPNGPMMMYGPQPQIVTNDLKSLDEMVRDLVEKCTCPSQFPMIRVSEGKYRIGDTKVLIFVRILRSHVMVRVGGGWDTLAHYLDKHDPCRCKAQHRSSVAARLITKTTNVNNGIELHKAQVVYDRSPTPSWKSTAHGGQTPYVESTGSTLSPQGYTRSRSRSPSTQRKINHNSETPANTLEKGYLASPRLIRRSMSPSPRRLEMKKKQNSLDSGSVSAQVGANNPSNTLQQATVHFECDRYGAIVTDAKSEYTGEDKSNKYENISDNGSEISDEGYRSLGLVQSNGAVQTQKRISLHSQASNEDAEISAHLEQNSSESQATPTDDLTTISDEMTTKSDDTEKDTALKVEPQAVETNFSKSGVYITDDEITIDVTNSTGLRKTEFSENLYDSNEVTTPKSSVACKIPMSPTPPRRKNVENVNTNDKASTLTRKIPTYRSVRKNNQTSDQRDSNTWSGRTAKQKPLVTSETFDNKTVPPGATLSRNSPARTPQCDKNGRRIKPVSTSVNTSPNKGSYTSALAQQLMEAASGAQNDVQMIEKVKQLLSKYSDNQQQQPQQQQPSCITNQYDDFTTAWVNNNGIVDHNTNSSPKLQSKRSSTVSTTSEGANCKEIPSVISPRREKGMSKIPAPVRSNTGLY
ncbi:GAS2-like protein pickled eggs [Toxorhynchites rutilus septentrionalis]|uniref:GAS2-like protein pickled eggs n=1 Tax=Toxorhynchites rutilus septentrionalis TaxID=329112 RepID=UPI00247A4AA3|nr:GAS2-like protein pickled eggs [Toxorhynchites rutilus septentrionalis]XP_055636803.1 GAS2-like protein pickled eggs [Toxorhynchites rutilus septentrionalis]XP_055636804.1 GAS2-like protein pickled eggs [Toxorhynchites rutilus septentrionalis]XP_055636805.1 GAS2-like protein pickled eggs [Toxorhynchites rutilus septentrionalis]XP_055636806.1 GAS2-like protein pickled eggs [Toxorhynchites rutilus septentrionalis]